VYLSSPSGAPLSLYLNAKKARGLTG